MKDKQSFNNFKSVGKLPTGKTNTNVKIYLLLFGSLLIYVYIYGILTIKNLLLWH